MAVKGFGRVFLVGVPDGEGSLRVLDGVRFPSGRCVLDDPEGGLFGAVSFEDLELPPGSEVEWADGGDAL